MRAGDEATQAIEKQADISSLLWTSSCIQLLEEKPPNFKEPTAQMLSKPLPIRALCFSTFDHMLELAVAVRYVIISDF